MNEANKKFEEELKLLRSRIDEVDEKIKSLLIERFDLIEKIVEIKKNLDAEYFDYKREETIYQLILKDLPEYMIKPIQSIFERILDESRTFQKIKINQNHPADDR